MTHRFRGHSWNIAWRSSLASWILARRAQPVDRRDRATLKSIARWYADLWHAERHGHA